MHRKLKLIHRRGRGSLYFVQPTDGQNQIITDLPVYNGSYTDARLEVDFYSLDCAKLQQLKTDIQNYLSTIRLTPDISNYYTGKLADLDTAIQTVCTVILPPPPIKVPDPIEPPPPPPPPPAKDPGVKETPSGLPGVTVNVGDTSSLNPTPGAGPSGGGGGGGGSSNKPADKKSNLWLWIVCIGALAVSLYEGRNTTIKMPA